MNGINKVVLVGTIVRAPETRHSQGGSMIANLTVVTNYKSKNGEEHPEFHRVVMFGRLGEIAAQYLDKGSQVYLEGRIQTRQYEKDGVKHYSTEVIAHEMQMLGGKRAQADNSVDSSTSSPEPKPEPEFDDIPF